MKTKVNIIFDYDGTLHNSAKIYIPAFKKAYAYLVERGYASHKVWRDAEISKWLGYTSQEMWDHFMGELPEYEKSRCSQIIGAEMLNLLKDGKGELYEGTCEVLKYLKEKNYRLIILSNCKRDYMNMHKTLFKLEQYFDDFYCAETFGFQPKYEIFNSIKNKYEGEFIIVGDRVKDIEVALKHQLYAIGCAYGFAVGDELRGANSIVYSIKEVGKVIDEYCY